MRPLDLALCALAHLGAPEGEASAFAEYSAEACADDPSCVVAAAVLWRMETAGTFTLTPSTKHACGPLQVTPASAGQTCAELRAPPVGVAAGVRVWLAKVRRVGGVREAAFRAYNGHPKHRDGYGRKALRLYRETVAGCGPLL
jgi:hypothetical protein